ncbi:MAG: hypothetical protein JJ934_02955 [Pseudomonadales bacterium]|nr:hypothetical protein [Pseudomonadales bacterium]MBO6701789.1 hypothetical protein [Pseudomonadales bacterium]MBO7007385.1 hypothetical protein [Pseudomonadales bacterium]
MQTTSNIVSLQKARGSGMMGGKTKTGADITEQRSEVRGMTGERLFVQITHAHDKDLIGRTMACKAMDSSAHGIKFLAEDFIPVGCRLDLWVDDQSRPGKFFLSGDTRWTQKAGSMSTMIGVRLQDGLATDIESWKENHQATPVL